MGNGTTAGQAFWSSVLRAAKWSVRTGAAALALYILFPPLWDAAFAANLEALHKAPYIAADRARHLLQVVRAGLAERSSRQETETGGGKTNDHR